MYGPADHDDLELAHDLMAWASELVNSVLERNRLDTPLQAISLLSGAKQDADHSIREIDMAERYMGWREGKTA